MGCCASKEDEAERRRAERQQRIRAGNVFFDQAGNFRVGGADVQLFDREHEAARVFEEDARVSDRLAPAPKPKPYVPEVAEVGAEEQKGEDEEALLKLAEAEAPPEPVVWYLVSSIWIEAWAGFVREGRVRPPPVSNHYLLQKDKTGIWVKKRKLRAAHSSGRGDYRRVGEAVWRELEALYPGSGPAITVTEAPAGEEEEWVIEGNAEFLAELEATRAAEDRAAEAAMKLEDERAPERETMAPLEIGDAEAHGSSGEVEPEAAPMEP